MEGLTDLTNLEIWLLQYGSIALFLLLALGIIALPVPEETLMVIAGALISHQKLHVLPTFTAALFGSICGITCSYMLGRTTGHFLIYRYGKWVGIGHKQVERAHNWFARFGRWALFIGYFIPGVRHFTGFIAGTTTLEYKNFALYAYSGALLWVSLFLSIGYFFGDYCSELCTNFEFNIEDILSVFMLFSAIYSIYLLNRKH